MPKAGNLRASVILFVIWHSTFGIDYLTVTVTGAKLRVMGCPSGLLATPVTVIELAPGVTASNTSAASRPAPEAPS